MGHDVVHHGIDLAVAVLDVVPDEVSLEARVLRHVGAAGQAGHRAFHRGAFADDVRRLVGVVVVEAHTGLDAHDGADQFSLHANFHAVGMRGGACGKTFDAES